MKKIIIGIVIVGWGQMSGEEYDSETLVKKGGTGNQFNFSNSEQAATLKSQPKWTGDEEPIHKKLRNNTKPVNAEPLYAVLPSVKAADIQALKAGKILGPTFAEKNSPASVNDQAFKAGKIVEVQNSLKRQNAGKIISPKKTILSAVTSKMATVQTPEPLYSQVRKLQPPALPLKVVKPTILTPGIPRSPALLPRAAQRVSSQPVLPPKATQLHPKSQYVQGLQAEIARGKLPPKPAALVRPPVPVRR